MTEAAPEVEGAVNAVRLRMDWRPLMGLEPKHAGTLVERVIARVVMERAVLAHNDDVRRAEKG
jgi:hypothetical protein